MLLFVRFPFFTRVINPPFAASIPQQPHTKPCDFWKLVQLIMHVAEQSACLLV